MSAPGKLIPRGLNLLANIPKLTKGIFIDRPRTTNGYEYFATIEGGLDGTDASEKTRGLLITLTRDDSHQTTVGDLEDTGLMIRVRTNATVAVAGNSQTGIDVESTVGNPSGTITNVYGGKITAYIRTGASSTTGYCIGLYVSCKTNYPAVTEGIGIDVNMYRQAATQPTSEYGIRIRNTGTVADTVDAAIKVNDAGTNNGWDYGLDLYGATIANNATSADIRLSTGVLFQSGAGTPTHSAPKGSIWIKTDGAADSMLYVATDAVGTWVAFENV